MRETGIFLRIKRGERWVDADLGEMTKEETENWVAHLNLQEAHKWINGLARFIREGS